MLSCDATSIHPVTGRPSLSPHSHARTTNSLPCGRPAPRAAIRVYRVPRRSHEWFRFRLFTGGVFVRAAPVLQEQTKPRSHFWVRPVSVFGLLVVTMFIGDSVFLTLPFSLAPPPHRHLQRRLGLTTSTWLTPGSIVSVASHKAVASTACTDRLRATERPVFFRQTSTAKQRTTRLSRRTSTITPRC